MGKIVAIGGGEIGRPKENGKGHYPVETTAIDNEIIRLANSSQTKLLFIPTASNDSASYAAQITKHFLTLGCTQVNVLRLSDSTLATEEIEQTILSHDIVYVGGGNTLRMMTIWRRLGVDKILKKAYDRGIVLAGLSAGAICWFHYGSSDSRKFSADTDKLIKVTGLNFVDILLCPHYDTEPARQRTLPRMVRSAPYVAVALDNCAALEIVDDSYRIILSKPTARAYKAYWEGGEYTIQALPPTDTFLRLSSLMSK